MMSLFFLDWLICVDWHYSHASSDARDQQHWLTDDVHCTWSNSCLPVVLGWMANSSSASMVVTRTLTCGKTGESRSSVSWPRPTARPSQVRTNIWWYCRALLLLCVCVFGRGCICRVNTRGSVFISAFSETDGLIEGAQNVLDVTWSAGYKTHEVYNHCSVNKVRGINNATHKLITGTTCYSVWINWAEEDWIRPLLHSLPHSPPFTELKKSTSFSSLFNDWSEWPVPRKRGGPSQWNRPHRQWT